MTEKEIMIHIIKNKSCHGISCVRSDCPGLPPYGIRCIYLDEHGIELVVSKVVDNFIKLYGKDELMEALL